MQIPLGASLHTSDRTTNRAFDWATRQALQYVNLDAPIGPCYEASLPGRQAFCMRDAAHQVLGAQVLGQGACNQTILHSFARELKESRGFCSLWEICFDGTPCAVDYSSDADFWYNLPANFDVLDACFRLYHWTGDLGYLFSADMERFHHITTHDYIACWDRDRDGIIDRRIEDGRRGIASYDESARNKGYRVAADLLGAQAAALRGQGQMLRMKGEAQAAQRMQERADLLTAHYARDWWHPGEQHFASVRFEDGSCGGEYVGMDAFMPLYYGIIDSPLQAAAQARYVVAKDAEHNQEERSYVPEILWRYGLNEDALRIWLTMTAPSYGRREYPEVSFAAVGAMASGYMGIRPDATRHVVQTCSALLGDDWAQMTGLPLWGGTLNLTHEGNRASTLENLTGSDMTWVCHVAGEIKTLHVPAGQVAQAR